jgi:hypothetical protein
LGDELVRVDPIYRGRGADESDLLRSERIADLRAELAGGRGPGSEQRDQQPVSIEVINTI